MMGIWHRASALLAFSENRAQILRMAYFRDDEVTKQFCVQIYFVSICGILAFWQCTMFCSVIALFRYAVAYRSS